MNVVIFAAYAFNTPHFETELEIAQGHLDQGDSVTILVCNANMQACDINPTHQPDTCMACMGRRFAGLERLSRGVRVRPFPFLSPADTEEIGRMQTRFSSIEELKAYRIDDFDIGYGALSSLVSLRRDPEIDLERESDLLKNLLQTSLAVYRSVQRYLSAHRTDRVYVYNGRYAPMRAVLRAARSRGVTCFTHEKGHDLQHYALYENTYPHDRQHVEQRIRKAWDQASGDPDREATARRWFEERARGIDRTWYSYVAAQKDAELPADWNPRKRNVAIFSSSEDEFVAIGDSWKHPLYETQLEGMRAIIASLQDDPGDLHLYLRLHPNLARVDNEQTREIHALRAPFLSVIPATATVSTYTLMRRADRVLTFGSTAGIEAVYWGVPSILAGTCYYQNLGGTYNPASHEELIALLRADLKPRDIEPALMYGHYLATFGIPFKYYRGLEILKGEFKGSEIYPGRIARAKAKILWRAGSLSAPRASR